MAMSYSSSLSLSLPRRLTRGSILSLSSSGVSPPCSRKAPHSEKALRASILMRLLGCVARFRPPDSLKVLSLRLLSSMKLSKFSPIFSKSSPDDILKKAEMQALRSRQAMKPQRSAEISASCCHTRILFTRATGVLVP